MHDDEDLDGGALSEVLHRYEDIAERLSPDGRAFDWTDQEQKTKLAKAALDDRQFEVLFEEFATRLLNIKELEK